MSSQLQEGIYYRTKPQIGNSFCVITLRAENKSQVSEIGNLLGHIWNRLMKLKNGIISDLEIDSKHRKTGNLTVLIGYGSNIFEIPGSKKNRPVSFSDEWNFRRPNRDGGGSIIEGSGITYSTKVNDNHMLFDHVMFQFIAENGFYTKRAAVDVWKEIHKWEKKTGNLTFRISGLYTGFQRADRRNWQGFHDGVSNLKSRERPSVISIGSKYLNPQDKWTLYGTYLAFMRIGIDLERWEDTNIRDQELMVGRNKLTGCPIVRIDQNGKPVKDIGCPVPGTTEIIDPGNDYFRDYPPYGIKSKEPILQQSHIRQARPVDKVPIWDRNSSRIFRQGFEFLVGTTDYPGFIAGLNFVSFQNSPERLFRTLTYAHTTIPKVLSLESLPNFERFFSVFAAGIFFVPPVLKDEPYPGARIFFRENELQNLSKSLRQ
jgi:deferrochelatase/peroxidase EfeB